MKILILHRVAFAKAKYNESIDHKKHDVYYLTTKEKTDIPALRANIILRDSKDSILDAVRHYINEKNIKFDRVISLSEYEIMDAALIREEFGIPGVLPSEIEKVRYKNIMKKLVIESGIKTSRFCTLNAFLTNPRVLEDVRLVIKPHDGSASANISLYPNAQELICDVKLGSLNVDDYIVEEYVTGDILHIDGIVKDCKVVALSFNRYINNCFSYAQGNPLGSYQIHYSNDLDNWTQQCINALNIKNGSFHLEAIESENGLYFLEMANRAGGSEIVNNFELSTGIHLYKAETMLYLDNSLDIKPNYTGMYYGFFLFPNHKLAGKYCKVSNHQEFLESPKILKYSIFPSKSKLSETLSYNIKDLPFAGVICGKNIQDNKQFIDSVLNKVKVIGCEKVC